MTEDSHEWVDRIRGLPDLLVFAREEANRTGADLYEVRDRLRAKFEESGKLYVLTTPYRTPPAACSTGEHQTPSLNHEILRPGKPQRTHSLLIAARALHEIEFHDRKFAPDQLRKLEAIFEGMQAPSVVDPDA